MSTLCIVDVQEEYVDSYPHTKVIPRVSHEVRLAQKRMADIFILEFDGWGDTLPVVMKAIGDYPYHRLLKHTDGGGYEIQSYARKNHIFIDRIRLCGVNRGYCVYATVKEIKYLMPDVGVTVAINATWCNEPNLGLQRLARITRFLYHGSQIDSYDIRKEKADPEFESTSEYDVDEREWDWD